MPVGAASLPSLQPYRWGAHGERVTAASTLARMKQNNPSSPSPCRDAEGQGAGRNGDAGETPACPLLLRTRPMWLSHPCKVSGAFTQQVRNKGAEVINADT